MSGNKTSTGSGQGQATSEEEALATIIGRVVDERLAPLQSALGQKATGNMAGAPGADSDRAPITGKEASEGTGIDFARIILCRYVSQSTGKTAESIAKLRNYGSRVVRSLSESEQRVQGFMSTRAIASGGSMDSLGVFVDTPIANEIFELLRPAVWIRARARTVPLVAGLDFNRQTSGGTAYYKDELGAIPTSGATAGREGMVERELTAINPVSNRLLQTAAIGVEEFLRDDLVQIIARKENLAFYRGDGTKGSPLGLRARAAEANKFNATQAGAEATLAEVRKDGQHCKLKLRKSDAPMKSPAWIMSPDTEAFLSSITDGNGNAVYEAQLSEGRWLGYEVDLSTQVPTNLGDGTETEVGFIDYSEVIIGQGDMFLEVFPNATYEANGQVVSGVARNQSVIRAIHYHDLLMRHSESAAFMQCKWTP